MSTKEVWHDYQYSFGPDDVVDVATCKYKGRLVKFSVNYRANIEGTWREVIRYDTHHERLHVHRYWRASQKQTEILEKREIEDYWPYYEKAKQELDENWERFRRLITWGPPR